jgi:hypothetical protein
MTNRIVNSCHGFGILALSLVASVSGAAWANPHSVIHEDSIDWDLLVHCAGGAIDVRRDHLNPHFFRVSINDSGIVEYLTYDPSVLSFRRGSSGIAKGSSNESVHRPSDFRGFMGAIAKNEKPEPETIRVFRAGSGLNVEIYSDGRRYMDYSLEPPREVYSAPSKMRDWYFNDCQNAY